MSRQRKIRAETHRAESTRLAGVLVDVQTPLLFLEDDINLSRFQSIQSVIL